MCGFLPRLIPQPPPLTARLAPSLSARFCPCPGSRPLVVPQADESHCPPHQSPSELCGPCSMTTGCAFNMPNGEQEQSHSPDDQSSEAPVGHSLGGHPRSQGHQAARQRTKLPGPGQQHPGQCHLSDSTCQTGGTTRNASSPRRAVPEAASHHSASELDSACLPV